MGYSISLCTFKAKKNVHICIWVSATEKSFQVQETVWRMDEEERHVKYIGGLFIMTDRLDLTYIFIKYKAS